MNIKYYFLALPFIITPSFVLAGESDHVGCDQVKVNAGMMGIVNEQTLQKHINQVKTSLDEIKSKPGRHADERRKMLGVHLANMRNVMEDIHAMKVNHGCTEAMHGSSVKARLDYMEKNIDMMQTMIQQLVEHQQEIERE